MSTRLSFSIRTWESTTAIDFVALLAYTLYYHNLKHYNHIRPQTDENSLTGKWYIVMTAQGRLPDRTKIATVAGCSDHSTTYLLRFLFSERRRIGSVTKLRRSKNPNPFSNGTVVGNQCHIIR